MDEMQLGGPVTRMILRCGGRLPSGAAELLSVTLEDSDLTVGRDVYEGYSDGFRTLGAFFRDLADCWRGWKGEKAYESIEHDLRVIATHDGHVRLRVRLCQSADPNGWTVETSLRLEAGEQLSQAARDVIALIGP